MKILLICANFLPTPEGGAERQCRLQATELARRGHEVVVLTSWRGRGAARKEIRDGFQVVRVGCLYPLVQGLWKLREILSGRKQGVYLGGVRVDDVAIGKVQAPGRRIRIMEMLEGWAQASYRRGCRSYACRRKDRMDIVHLHADSLEIVGTGMWIGRHWSAPVFCKPTIMPLRIAAWGSVSYVKQAAATSNRLRFLAITPEIHAALLGGAVPATDIFDLPNGVAMPPASHAASSEPIVLNVANFSQGGGHKAFDTLLLAWALVSRQRPDARLHFVGAGDAAPWEAMAAKLGCSQSVQFIGRLTDPSSAYERAMMFVLPSRWEGLSNALLEAQSHGLPCVVSNLPSNTHVVQHMRNGWVVPVDDAPALASAILELLEKADLRQRLGAAARQRMEAEFSMTSVVARLEQLYGREIQKAGA